MQIKILHTADLHLGMKFTRGYAPEIQENLIRARFENLGKMIQMANDQDCHLFVIAGDLFNAQGILKKDLVSTAEILKEFEGRLVLILPGNHDYVQKGEDHLWTRFHQVMAENTLLLEEQKPYDLRPYDLDMIVYAGPCTAKHSDTNAIGWIRETPKDTNVKFHVGIAHGSLQGLSPDFNRDYYPMSKEELLKSDLDLWLMGHTHIRYPAEDTGTKARIFFPATPEPDGFDCKHPGYAWLIEADENNEVRYQAIQTGTYQFLTLEMKLSNEEDIEALRSRFQELDNERHLVKLKLEGRIAGDLYDQKGDLLAELKDRVLHLEEDLSQLYREITTEDIDREFTEGSFPHTLLTTLSQTQRNPLSLQIAYDFIQRSKA